MNIEENIKKYRKENKITQKEISGILGVNIRTYQKYESGDIKPNISTLAKISNALGVAIGDLTGENVEGGYKFDNPAQLIRSCIRDEMSVDAYKIFLFRRILENLGYKASTDGVGLYMFIQDINTKEDIARIDNSDFYDIASNIYWIIENIVENMINNNTLQLNKNKSAEIPNLRGEQSGE